MIIACIIYFLIGLFMVFCVAFVEEEPLTINDKLWLFFGGLPILIIAILVFTYVLIEEFFKNRKRS